VLAGVNNINIAPKTVCAVILSRRGGIDQRLNTFRGLVKRRVDPNNLPRQTAYDGDNVAVFAGFTCTFLPDEPVKLIYF